MAETHKELCVGLQRQTLQRNDGDTGKALWRTYSDRRTLHHNQENKAASGSVTNQITFSYGAVLWVLQKTHTPAGKFNRG